MVCADHNVAWRIHKALGLVGVPAGVSPNEDDGIVYDIVAGARKSGLGHPTCTGKEPDVAKEIGSGVRQQRDRMRGLRQFSEQAADPRTQAQFTRSSSRGLTPVKGTAGADVELPFRIATVNVGMGEGFANLAFHAQKPPQWGSRDAET